MLHPIHPRILFWLEIGGFLYDTTERVMSSAKQALRVRRRGSYATRRPGEESPLWNVCAELLRAELRPFGAKVRLARYLGIPKQRLNDYMTGRNRLPDAEITLQMLNWLAEKRAGKDLSL